MRSAPNSAAQEVRDAEFKAPKSTRASVSCRSRARTQSNRRTCGDEHVSRLHFIRPARELGVAIEDIRQLLALLSDPPSSVR